MISLYKYNLDTNLVLLYVEVLISLHYYWSITSPILVSIWWRFRRTRPLALARPRFLSYLQLPHAYSLNVHLWVPFSLASLSFCTPNWLPEFWSLGSIGHELFFPLLLLLETLEAEPRQEPLTQSGSLFWITQKSLDTDVLAEGHAWTRSSSIMCPSALFVFGIISTIKLDFSDGSDRLSICFPSPTCGPLDREEM